MRLHYKDSLPEISKLKDTPARMFRYSQLHEGRESGVDCSYPVDIIGTCRCLIPHLQLRLYGKSNSWLSCFFWAELEPDPDHNY